MLDLSCSWSSMSSGRSAVTILAVPEVHTASERLELTKASFSVRAFYKAESDPETGKQPCLHVITALIADALGELQS